MKIHKNVVIPDGVIVFLHEVNTANALAIYGHKVEFLRPQYGYKLKSADILLDGIVYEMKAPVSHKMSMVEQNLKKASKQASHIVFDSQRMKGLPDQSILRELTKQYQKSKAIKGLIFVDKHGNVVDVANTTLIK